MSTSYSKESARKIVVRFSLIIVEITIHSLFWSLPWRKQAAVFDCLRLLVPKAVWMNLQVQIWKGKRKGWMSHMPVPATPSLKPVSGVKEQVHGRFTCMCLCVCTRWVFLDIWGLVHNRTTVAVDLIGRSHSQPPESGTRMTTQNEVLVTSLRWTISCMVLIDGIIKDGTSNKV